MTHSIEREAVHCFVLCERTFFRAPSELNAGETERDGVRLSGSCGLPRLTERTPSRSIALLRRSERPVSAVDRDRHEDQPSTPTERLSPQDGDVVVTREAHSRVHYTVRQLPGIVQFSAAVREQAELLARGFGQKFKVDVWYRDGGTYRQLEAHRPQTSTRAPLRPMDDVGSDD